MLTILKKIKLVKDNQKNKITLAFKIKNNKVLK